MASRMQTAKLRQLSIDERFSGSDDLVLDVDNPALSTRWIRGAGVNARNPGKVGDWMEIFAPQSSRTFDSTV